MIIPEEPEYMLLWLSDCEWNQLDGRVIGLDLIIGDFGEMWESVSQGPATENIAVLTTSSFCVYLDTFWPSLWQCKRSEVSPSWECLVFLILQANVPFRTSLGSIRATSFRIRRILHLFRESIWKSINLTWLSKNLGLNSMRCSYPWPKLSRRALV